MWNILSGKNEYEKTERRQRSKKQNKNMLHRSFLIASLRIEIPIASENPRATESGDERSPLVSVCILRWRFASFPIPRSLHLRLLPLLLLLQIHSALFASPRTVNNLIDDFWCEKRSSSSSVCVAYPLLHILALFLSVLLRHFPFGIDFTAVAFRWLCESLECKPRCAFLALARSSAHRARRRPLAVGVSGYRAPCCSFEY